MNFHNSTIMNSSSSTAPPPSNDILKLVIKLSNVIYPLFLSLTSTAGNILSFIVFSSKVFQISGSSLFLRVKALVDILNVYLGTLRYTYLGATDFDLKNASKFWCYFLTVSVYTVDAFASWLNVFISLDRLVLVFRPIAYKTISKTRLFKIQLGVLVVAFALITIVNVSKIAQQSFTIQRVNKSGEVVSIRSCSSTMAYTSDLINVIMTLIIPFVLMIVFSSILALQLIRSKSRMNKYSRGKTTLNFNRKNVIIIKTVICLDIFFLIFNVPRFILQFIKDNSMIYIFILQYSTAFKYSYYSFSILVYVAANKLFRVRLKEIMKIVQGFIFKKAF